MATEDKNVKEFALEDFKLNPLSSLEMMKRNLPVNEEKEHILFPAAEACISAQADLTAAPIELSDKIEDPIFKELSEPTLPALAKENRARLQMQSPNRIYFYWSFNQNPFQILNRVFGSRTNYQLIAKLVNQSNRREQIFPIEAEGSAWFDVDADSTYRVEVGFYAVSRPFVRVMFSNTIETPRKNPSPRRDYSPYFAVSANQFAEVLEVSGFQQDAFEVALAGDDSAAADNATQTAFSQLTGGRKNEFDENLAGEIRFILLALASGYSLEDLRGQISPSLFDFLLANLETLSAAKALAVLQENFGVFTDENVEEEFVGATVFGASLINFPRFSKRRFLPKLAPLSSFRLIP